MERIIYIVLNIYPDGDAHPIFACTTREAAEASIEDLEATFPDGMATHAIKEIYLYEA